MIKPNAGSIALGHIGLSVSDLDVSEGFYQEVFGLRVADESLQFPFRYASMVRDGKTVITLWEQSRRRIKKRRPGLHHLAFEARSLEEVNRTKGLLAGLGMHWTEGVRIYPEGSRAEAIHFEDPDGIRIEVYSDRGALEHNCSLYSPQSIEESARGKIGDAIQAVDMMPSPLHNEPIGGRTGNCSAQCALE